MGTWQAEKDGSAGADGRRSSPVRKIDAAARTKNGHLTVLAGTPADAKPGFWLRARL